MIYKTNSDMFIDNRNGLIDAIQKAGSKEEAEKAALNAYDWAVSQFFGSEAAYAALRNGIDCKYGEGSADSIDSGESMFHEFMHNVSGMIGQYMKDVSSGKRVGYSEFDGCEDDE